MIVWNQIPNMLVRSKNDRPRLACHWRSRVETPRLLWRWQWYTTGQPNRHLQPPVSRGWSSFRGVFWSSAPFFDLEQCWSINMMNHWNWTWFHLLCHSFWIDKDDAADSWRIAADSCWSYPTWNRSQKVWALWFSTTQLLFNPSCVLVKSNCLSGENLRFWWFPLILSVHPHHSIPGPLNPFSISPLYHISMISYCAWLLWPNILLFTHLLSLPRANSPVCAKISASNDMLLLKSPFFLLNFIHIYISISSFSLLKSHDSYCFKSSSPLWTACGGVDGGHPRARGDQPFILRNAERTATVEAS